MNNIDDSPPQSVTVTDVRMPFKSMVVFMVKWAFASIPAVIILTAVSAAVVLFTIASVGFLATRTRTAEASAMKAAGFHLSDATPTDPSGVRETGKIYLDYPHMLFHEPGCRDVASIPSPMAYDRDAAVSSGYKPHSCVRNP
jgi:hypothetical protein